MKEAKQLQTMMYLPEPLKKKMMAEVKQDGWGKLTNLIIHVFQGRYAKKKD